MWRRARIVIKKFLSSLSETTLMHLADRKNSGALQLAVSASAKLPMANRSGDLRANSSPIV